MTYGPIAPVHLKGIDAKYKTPMGSVATKLADVDVTHRDGTKGKALAPNTVATVFLSLKDQGLRRPIASYAFVYVHNTTGADLPVDVATASADSMLLTVRGVDGPVACSDPSDDPADGCEVVLINSFQALGPPGWIEARGSTVLPPGTSLLTVKVVDFGFIYAARLRLEDPATGDAFRDGEVVYSLTP